MPGEARALWAETLRLRPEPTGARGTSFREEFAMPETKSDKAAYHTPDPEADRLAELEDEAEELLKKIDTFESEALPKPKPGDQPGVAV
jgi:hypothetical protein